MRLIGTLRATLLATLFCVTSVALAFAQHSGHGGTSTGGAFGHAGHDREMRDFNRGLLLSASEDQRQLFAKCTTATEQVIALANRMVGPGTPREYDAAVFSRQEEQLRTAVAELENAHQHFSHGLNQAQEKELRKYLSKLERYQRELASRIAKVDRELATNRPDPRRLYSDTHKIREVAEKWHSEHQKIAKEMGIDG